MKESTKKKINKIVDQTNEKYGEGTLLFGIDAEKFKVEVIKSGSLFFDMVSGIGGIPRGRFTHLWGPESCGKTTLCCCMVAKAQEDDLVCAILDPEPLEDNYAESLGVNLDTILRSKSKQILTGEKWLQLGRDLINKADVDLIIIDSLAAMVPQIEFFKKDKKGNIKDNTFDDKSMAALASLLSQALRILNTEMNHRKGKKPAVVFTNQFREKIGTIFGDPSDFPGGHALKHYISLSIRMSKSGKDIITSKVDEFDSKTMEYKEVEKQIGFKIRLKQTKTKLSIPTKPQFVTIYEDGINPWEEEFVAGVMSREIVKKGQRWRFINEEKQFWKHEIIEEIHRRKLDSKSKEKQDEEGVVAGSGENGVESSGLDDEGSKSSGESK